MRTPIKVHLTKEQLDAYNDMSIASANELFEVFRVRFVIEDGKITGVEI